MTVPSTCAKCKHRGQPHRAWISFYCFKALDRGALSINHADVAPPDWCPLRVPEPASVFGVTVTSSPDVDPETAVAVKKLPNPLMTCVKCSTEGGFNSLGFTYIMVGGEAVPICGPCITTALRKAAASVASLEEG